MSALSEEIAMARARHPRSLRSSSTLVPILLLALGVCGCLQRPATMKVSTQEIVLGDQSSSSSFDVKNTGRDGLLTSGVRSLDYSISVDKDWLTVDPALGKCGAGQQIRHAVIADRTRMLIGNNIATIKIASNDGPWSILVYADNLQTSCTAAPVAPGNPVPASATTGLPITTDLAWSEGASQCPGLLATYDVYFGTHSPPALHHDNGGAKSWEPGPLAPATTHFWRVVAKDANGSTSGPEWRFTTAAEVCTALPSAVALVSPAHGAVSVPADQDLTWSAGESTCPGLTASYEVRFGTSATPPSVGNNGTSKTWDPGPLASATTYYWQIVATDLNGSNPGPVWSFTTAAPPCTSAPLAACSPSPATGASGVNENADLAWGCGDSPCSGVVPSYDVYFGTNPTPGPGELLGNSAIKSWVLPKLLKNTTYYWRVVVKDANGSTPGPVWSYRTRL